MSIHTLLDACLLQEEVDRLRAINAELVKQSNEYVVMNARLSERNAELLAALEWCERRIAQGNFPIRLDAARAAIAKAKGE